MHAISERMVMGTVQTSVAPPRTHRADYRPSEYRIDSVDLYFDLALPVTTVTSRLSVSRVGNDSTELVLDGESLDLAAVRLNGALLPSERYSADSHCLRVFDVPPHFNIEVSTRLRPAHNPGLEGLNHGGDLFFTHCEPEGFRRITYFIDRPDMMTRYRCTLVADPVLYPTLLSNGNLVSQGLLDDGRYFARWEDPYPKASYLFALVAGDFATRKDSFVTRSGRRVALTVYASLAELPYCEHGLSALKQAMAWDENAYGLEYDLDTLNIVVMRSYPGGAMECKGLNLYATEFFLGSPEISTDEELMRIAGIVGHEYLHNWTGNRIGCRDWFELSLKEGFTVYRQQQFMAALFGGAAMRIDDVWRLRELQYPEDEGGMAHPVRPASYFVVSNLYTRTVYEKGAELLRMLNVVVGDATFQRGVREFFARFDGQAATIDSFLETIGETAGADLRQFKHWYDSVGRVRLKVTPAYDAGARRYTILIEQERARPDHTSVPLHIPLRLGLVGADGEAVPLRLSGESLSGGNDRVVHLHRQCEKLTFEDVMSEPVPSLLRGFSAPVEIVADLSDDALALLAARDPDRFNRWESTQQLAFRALLRYAGGSEEAGRSAAAAWERVIEHTLEYTSDHSLAARVLEIPSTHQLGLRQGRVDVEALASSRARFARQAASRFRRLLRQVYTRSAASAAEKNGFGSRRLRNRCLWYLMQDPGPEDISLAKDQFRFAHYMEDVAAALAILADLGGEDREEALQRFYARWSGVPSALDRWFATQAASQSSDCARRVASLTRHPAWSVDNATRLKAVLDVFTLNQTAFHDISGLGYDMVIRVIACLRTSNPRLAARFLRRFDGWQRFDIRRRQFMADALQSVLALPEVPRELYEIASQSLQFGERVLAVPV